MGQINLGKSVTDALDKKKWIIPVSFIFTVLITVAGFVLLANRGISSLEKVYDFNIGADLFCLAICSMLFFSCIQDRGNRGGYTRVFVLLLSICATGLFLDECCWLVQGVAELRVFNTVTNVLYYANGAISIYFFLRFVTNALNLDGRLMRALNLLLNVLLVPTVVLCFVNFFYPIYFSVDEAGVYARAGASYFISQVYLVLGMIVVIVGLIISRAPVKTRIIMASFVAIPVANQILTVFEFGLSTQYASMLVSIVLIYGVVFADREKMMAANENELALATRIQTSMLPTIFPAFPERSDLDIYASMDPAKEVGGDFYDFFLMDNDRLVVVIADVSGKGVPAALFMMATKILIENCVQSCGSPAEALSKVNDQICRGNQADMFVTVWLGVLDLKTGLLTAANAGHEYPFYKDAGGSFEIVRDKHGFVIGGMQGIKYREYTVQMQKGSKLFIYTDGVPEATDEKKEMFGVGRLQEALNVNEGGTPREILEGVSGAVAAFVGEAPQFDDLTMLCIEFKGKE